MATTEQRAGYRSRSGKEAIVREGNNVLINIDGTDTAEQDKLFAALGDGGTVLMPLADQFWGARFGMLKRQVRPGMDVKLRDEKVERS